jgi:FtsH-binding integral membrane protein
MFIGHFAVAYASKRVAPRTNLGWLFFCAQFADLLWPVLVLEGVEVVHIAPGDTAFTPLRFDYYPWSHSLLMDVIWGVVLASVYWTLRRDRNGAGVTFTLVVSHWVLDWIAHRPDMPFYPGSAWRAGLGLWNSVPLTLLVESLMFVGGLYVYMVTTHAKDKVGKYGAWALAGLLVALYLASTFSPPPKTVEALALGGLLGFPLTLLPWWTDRHRTT